LPIICQGYNYASELVMFYGLVEKVYLLLQ